MVRHETLYLYVYDRPETLADRQHNDEMMELARQIRTKRMIDISSAYYGITKKAALFKGDFLQYFEERCMINNCKYQGVTEALGLQRVQRSRTDQPRVDPSPDVRETQGTVSGTDDA